MGMRGDLVCAPPRSVCDGKEPGDVCLHGGMEFECNFDKMNEFRCLPPRGGGGPPGGGPPGVGPPGGGPGPTQPPAREQICNPGTVCENSAGERGQCSEDGFACEVEVVDSGSDESVGRVFELFAVVFDEDVSLTSAVNLVRNELDKQDDGVEFKVTAVKRDGRVGKFRFFPVIAKWLPPSPALQYLT